MRYTAPMTGWYSSQKIGVYLRQTFITDWAFIWECTVSIQIVGHRVCSGGL